MSEKSKNKIELKCLNCGKSHFKLQCQLGRGRGKYCSKICKHEASKNKIEIKCDNCNTEFKRHPSEMDSDKKFCSKACYKNFRSKNIKSSTYKKRNGRHQHRTIAEKFLKRKLKRKEVVHHIDENKHNNSPENLAVLPNQKIHALVHFNNYDFEKYKLLNLANGIS
jgi:hypothetical protein